MADDLTLNTQQKMDEALDQFMEDGDDNNKAGGGAGGTHKSSKHKQSLKKEVKSRKAHKSFDELSALPAPSTRMEESQTAHPFGNTAEYESTEVNHDNGWIFTLW